MEGQSSTDFRNHILQALQEYRFELESAKDAISIRLVSGTAECFGMELALDVDYPFAEEARGAIFTWSGCELQIGYHSSACMPCFQGEDEPSSRVYMRLSFSYRVMSFPLTMPAKAICEFGESGLISFLFPPPSSLLPTFYLPPYIYVFGQVSTEYISEETPVPAYHNLHLALERLRVLAHSGQHASPRVLLIGEEECGKTSLLKTLANWAIRSGRARTERDPPPGEAADEGEGKSRGVLLVNLDTSEVCPTCSIACSSCSLSCIIGSSDYAWNNHSRPSIHYTTIIHTCSAIGHYSCYRCSTPTQYSIFFTSTQHDCSHTSFNGFIILVWIDILG